MTEPTPEAIELRDCEKYRKRFAGRCNGCTPQLACWPKPTTADRPAPEAAAPLTAAETLELAAQAWSLARRSTPSQEDTQPVSGWVLVPRDPTDAMVSEALRENFLDDVQIHREEATRDWRVMIDAAPSPPKDAGGPGSASNTDAAQKKAPEVSESYRALVKEMQTNPCIFNLSMVDQMTKIEGEPTQTVAAAQRPTGTECPHGRHLCAECDADYIAQVTAAVPGPTVGDVERAEAVSRRWAEANYGPNAGPLLRLTEMIAGALSAARAELLAQIREPTYGLAKAVEDAIRSVRSATGPAPVARAMAAMRALADKLTEAK